MNEKEQKQQIRENKKKLTRMMLKFPGKTIKTLINKTPADLYQTLNHGIKPEFYTDLNRALWLNFGYWKTAKTYTEACADMARQVAEAARLDEQSILLDVGFGFGEQDLLWAREFNVRHITGINITPLHVKVASDRVSRAGLSDRIELARGNATDLKFPNESFNRITAVECAFHFNTRRDFFKEAYRVLKPGGYIGLADCLPQPEKKKDFWYRLASKQMAIPFENNYDRNKYKKILEDIGFYDVRIESVAREVYPASLEYFRQMGKGVPQDQVVVEAGQFSDTVDDWSASRGWFMGFDDYVIVSAKK